MIASHHVARVLSIATGMPLSAVNWRIQLLKKAGLLPKDGPGVRGHAPLEPRDLAVCLLAAASPGAKEAPALVQTYGALPFASFSETEMGFNGWRSIPIEHPAEAFQGTALDALARLLTHPAGEAIGYISVTIGKVPAIALKMPKAADAPTLTTAVATYAPEDVVGVFLRGAAQGDRRTIIVHLEWPAFPLLRGLVGADARGEDLDRLIEEEAKRWEPASIAPVVDGLAEHVRAFAPGGLEG